MSEVFQLYSKYTGTGIIMVLFFTALVYIALNEQNKSTRTIVLYASIVMVALIFVPPVYYLYVKYVDTGTYWRMWWMIPTGIGMAYVGTLLIHQHKSTGLILTFVILLLGGEFVYSGTISQVMPAENAYQLPQEVIDIADYIEDYDDYVYIYAAYPPELLIYIRQYDINMQMPYGREMLDVHWGGNSGFYDCMAQEKLDFEQLMQWCKVSNIRYLVVNHQKEFLNDPEKYEFRLLTEIDQYSIYENTTTDWDNYNELIFNPRK